MLFIPLFQISLQNDILKYPDHGEKYGLPIINRAIEDGMKEGIF
jgi:hypothetical protein